MNKLIFKYFIYDLGLNVLFDPLIKAFGLLHLTELDLYHIKHNIINFLIKKYGFTHEMFYANNARVFDLFVDTLFANAQQRHELCSDMNIFRPYIDIIVAYEKKTS